MTIAISVVVLIDAIALVYFGLAILEIREKMNNVYPELMKIINAQQDVLNGTLDSLRRWSDLSADIIDHIERVEDMEGDIKDIFEWIHSVDDNVAGMRMDIQDTDTKLGDLMAIHDRDILKIKKKISGIKEHLGFEDEEEYDRTNIIVDDANHGDTDGDIPTNIISGRGNYRQFLSSSDKDVNALYEKIVDRSMKKYEFILKEKDQKGDDKDDVNGDE